MPSNFIHTKNFRLDIYIYIYIYIYIPSLKLLSKSYEFQRFKFVWK